MIVRCHRCAVENELPTAGSYECYQCGAVLRWDEGSDGVGEPGPAASWADAPWTASSPDAAARDPLLPDAARDPLLPDATADAEAQLSEDDLMPLSDEITPPKGTYSWSGAPPPLIGSDSGNGGGRSPLPHSLPPTRASSPAAAEDSAEWGAPSDPARWAVSPNLHAHAATVPHSEPGAYLRHIAHIADPDAVSVTPTIPVAGTEVPVTPIDVPVARTKAPITRTDGPFARAEAAFARTELHVARAEAPVAPESAWAPARWSDVAMTSSSDARPSTPPAAILSRDAPAEMVKGDFDEDLRAMRRRPGRALLAVAGIALLGSGVLIFVAQTPASDPLVDVGAAPSVPVSAPPSPEPAPVGSAIATAIPTLPARQSPSAAPPAFTADRAATRLSNARQRPAVARQESASVPKSAAPSESEEDPNNGSGSGAQESTFDVESAKQALDDATQNALSCKDEGGPTGVARVTVTFAPEGRPAAVSVAGPGFTGTVEGQCIAAKFRAARVPEFSGDRVTVHRSIRFR
jgi:hypothetical protein